MEERASHSTYYDDHDHDHDHHQQHGVVGDEGLFVDEDEDEINSLRHKDINNNIQSMQIVPSNGSTHSQPHATFIVQIPKDQIYRVPPPENAEIVERYRNPVDKKKKGSGCGGRRRRCAYWLLSIIFVVAFIVSVVVCVNKFTLSPNPPSFSIKHLTVKQPPKSSSKKIASPGFQVRVETANPNSVNDLGYSQGSASLSYKGKVIGKGQVPATDNEAPGKTDAFDIVFAGSSKAGLPKDLQSAIGNDKKSRNKKGKTVDMSLSMKVPVKMKTWLWTKTVNFDVNCKFEADTMGDNIMKVQSQNCDVKK